MKTLDNLETMCLEILYKAYQNAWDNPEMDDTTDERPGFSDEWMKEYETLQNLELAGIFEQDGDLITLDEANSSVDFDELEALMGKYGI